MSALAVHIDNSTFARRGIAVAPSDTPPGTLPEVSQVHDHFQGRPLLRYVRQSDLAQLSTPAWFNRPHWLTPTPLCPRDIKAYLHLPSFLPQPTHAIIVDPAFLPVLRGPRYVEHGLTIEYISAGLPDGAIIGPKWAVEL